MKTLTLSKPLSQSAEHPVTWLIVSSVSAVGVGVLAHEDTTVLADVGLVVAAIVLFLKWPYAMLILILATGWKDNQALELFTLAGGGVASVLVGRRGWRSVTAISLGLLLLLALPRLPLQPTYTDGKLPDHLYVPFTPLPYLGTTSSEVILWWRLGFVLVAFLLGSWLIRDRQRLGQAVAVSLASAAVPIGVGLNQFATGDLVTRTGTTTRAITGPFSYPNYFGFYLMAILTVGLVAFLEAKSTRWRLAIAPLLIAGTFCLFLTYTRSAWLSFAAAVLLLAIFRYRWMITFGSVVLLAASFAFPGAVHAVNSRFADLSSNSPTNENSYAWRKGEWARMVSYGLRNPIIGTGFGSFEADTVREFGLTSSTYITLDDPRHPADSVKGFAAHNDYVRMLVELGFPGAILWTVVLASLVGTAFGAARVKVLRAMAVGVGAVVVGLMVASYSDNVQGYTIDLLYPFVLGGGLASVARTERVLLNQDA